MKTFISEKHQNEAIASLKAILLSFLFTRGWRNTFRKDIQAVLEKTLEITKELGFQTYIDPEGYYGYAEIGEGEELFAVTLPSRRGLTRKLGVMGFRTVRANY